MRSISDEAIRVSDRMLVDRYTQRLLRFGDAPQTLGWDTRAHQDTRFAIALSLATFYGKSVLDVGCGLADFHTFLYGNGIHIRSYTGIDINEHLLARCRLKHPAATFVLGNILLDDPPEHSYDIVVAFGLVNFRFKDFSAADYADTLLQRTFDLCRDTAVVDALSERRDNAYAAESFVHYHAPAELLTKALAITPHVALRHNYTSIPQRELMLAMHRTPRE